MKDLVLDLITSYEDRISLVERLTANVYETISDSDEYLAQAQDKSNRLMTEIRETLVRNCSLRRTDFDNLMKRTVDENDRKKIEIIEERKQVGERLRSYLNCQKEIIASLKGQLTNFNPENSSKNSIEAILINLKVTMEKDGEQAFALLRDFKWHLEAFYQELKMLNGKLQRLLDRGKLLKVDDLRQLEAVKDREHRIDDREVRRRDVERLLTHFRQQRHQTGYQRQNKV